VLAVRASILGAGARGGAVLDLLPVPWRVASFCGGGARGAAAVVLVSVPWCVAFFRRLGCAWRRCGGAPVRALVRRVVLEAGVRVSLL